MYAKARTVAGTRIVTRVRYSASAAALKPTPPGSSGNASGSLRTPTARTWGTPPPSSSPPSNPGRNAAGSGHTSSTQPSGSSLLAGLNNKWSRPDQGQGNRSSTAGSQGRGSGPSRGGNGNHHSRNDRNAGPAGSPRNTGSTRQPPPLYSDPARTPPASNMSKWTVPVPPAQAASTRQPPDSRFRSPSNSWNRRDSTPPVTGNQPGTSQNGSSLFADISSAISDKPPRHDNRSDARSSRGVAPHKQPLSSTRLDVLPQRGVAPHLTPQSSPAPSSPRSQVSGQPSVSAEPPAKGPKAAYDPSSIFDADADAELNSRPRTLNSRDRGKGRGSLRTRVEELRASDFQPPIAAIPQRPRRVKLKTLQPVQIDVYIPSMCSVGNLARLLGVRLDALRRKMARAGMKEESNYDHILTAEYASLLAMEFDRNPIVNDEAAFDVYPPEPETDTSNLPPRPPVVTIMGHVDHGKTTLLDTLRSASVAKGEAGGITQHIGAFSVPVASLSTSKQNKTADAGDGPKSITFLDTPGHAAFSAMRARGANVTDVVVLVVAADDGVMPQTKEVIELVKKDNVQLVVAINKVDKPSTDVDRVMKELLVEGIQLEEFGGDVPSVQVSGLTGHGLPELIETISALAEMADLRSARDGVVHGHVLESRVQRGMGAVATVLVARGCLKPGMNLVCGTTTARVRAMADSAGKPVKAAYPGDAVTVAGWREVPAAGDDAISCTEAEGKKALTNRVRKREQEQQLKDVEAINAARRVERDLREAEERATAAGKDFIPEKVVEDDGRKLLKLVIKGDVSGSVEAVAGALEGIGNDIAGVKIISTGVGDVTETDVQLASTAQGVIVAFSVGVPRSSEQAAASAAVPISRSGIIYQLMDDVKARVIKLLPVIIEYRVTGEATVLQTFDIHLKAKQTMKVAGCRVMNGLVEKDKHARVVRNGEVIFSGPLETLRQLKKDVTEVRKGIECGISIRGFTDYRDGDQIQSFQEIEKPGLL